MVINFICVPQTRLKHRIDAAFEGGNWIQADWVVMHQTSLLIVKHVAIKEMNFWLICNIMEDFKLHMPATEIRYDSNAVEQIDQ